MDIDVRALELLASKLCHDLISPVSAINNGVELIDDIGGSVVDEAMKLIGDSAGQAARRLKLYRLAYGRAGGEDNVSVRDVRQVAMQVFSAGKMAVNWPEDSISESSTGTRGALKVILNLLILSEEVLAYGGAVSVGSSDGVLCRLDVTGRSAALNVAVRDVLDGRVAVDDLTPRTIQAYMTKVFASHFGFKVKSTPLNDDHMHFDVQLSADEHMGNQLVANY